MTPDKVCPVCGRRFAWRRKWAHNWQQVRYCSDRCRRHGLSPLDLELERALLAMLDRRGPGKSLCPSELARQLRGEETAWRGLLEPIRRAARRLQRRGELEIVQSGQPVDPDHARGPIRLRRRRDR